MRWTEPSPRLEAIVVAALVLFGIAVAAAVVHTSSWSSTAAGATAGAVTIAATVTLTYLVARALGGPSLGLLAAVLLILAPAVGLRYWRYDVRAAYHDFLPHLLGFSHAAAATAGWLVLAAAWLVLRRDERRELAWALAAGLAVGAAVLVDPRTWPAAAAPALALAVARRPRACAAAAAAAGACVLVAWLARDLPGIGFSLHRLGTNSDVMREYSWSRRSLEYLGFAGVVALALRSAVAGTLFGWLFFALVLLPLAHVRLTLDAFWATLVPGLPVYVVLAASVVLLVPRRSRAREPRAHAAGYESAAPR